MLAFIGSLYNGTLDKSLLKAMAHSLLYNIIGVLVVGAAFGVIYLGYFLGLFGQEEENKLSRRYSICMDICNYSSWILVIASYTLFLIQNRNPRNLMILSVDLCFFTGEGLFAVGS